MQKRSSTFTFPTFFDLLPSVLPGQPSLSLLAPLSSQLAVEWLLQKMYMGRYKQLSVRVRHHETIG